MQEVLERARKAESEASSLKSQLKSESTSSKRTIREMEAQLLQSTALSQKSEREYITLRDALKQLSESWKLDLERIKKEMKEREEKVRKEEEEMGEKYRKLVEEVEEERKKHDRVKSILEEERRIQREWEEGFKAQLDEFHGSVLRSETDSATAKKMAQQISNELLRLRSLIRAVEGSDENIEQ